jgi:hypothetical protein
VAWSRRSFDDGSKELVCRYSPLYKLINLIELLPMIYLPILRNKAIIRLNVIIMNCPGAIHTESQDRTPIRTCRAELNLAGPITRVRSDRGLKYIFCLALQWKTYINPTIKTTPHSFHLHCAHQPQHGTDSTSIVQSPCWKPSQWHKNFETLTEFFRCPLPRLSQRMHNHDPTTPFYASKSARLVENGK